MDKKIVICIAGYGGFAKNQLHPRLARMGECEVKYLYHPNPAKAAAYGNLGSSDLDAILYRVDAVIVASPNDEHFELLRRILDSDSHPHVFVEKPMVNTRAEATHLAGMRDLQPKDSSVFMVGHCQRREGVYRRAKELIDDGMIGAPVSVDFNVSSGKVYTMRKDDWRASKERNDLGPLAMVGSHCIDTIHYLFGAVESVYAKLSNVSGLTKAPDTSAVTLNLVNGMTVFLRNNYSVPSEKRCHISGTEGTMTIDRGKLFVRRGREKYQEEPTRAAEWWVPSTDPIEEELQEFLDAIRTGKKVETGYEEGLAVVKVLDACRRSAKLNNIQRP